MNMIEIEIWAKMINDQGFALLPQVLAPAEAVEAASSLVAALLGTQQEAALRSEVGALYAARNVLTVWPPAITIWRRSPLLDLLASVLGERFGLVRGLYFDKPPGETWALGWHKDMTIAVRDNRLPSTRFVKPTFKAGVPHVEAPLEVLEGMLTARIHLDEATGENGPLKVIPGSHRTGKRFVMGDANPHTVLAAAGDVLLMRPLLAHASGRSHPDTPRHRRILHLEFAAEETLSDGYAWHTFHPTRQP